MYVIELTSRARKKVKKMDTQELKSFKKFLAIACLDPFDSRLKTHKLNGELKDSYSARISYSNRAIFFIYYEKNIYITDIGSHDEVY